MVKIKFATAPRDAKIVFDRGCCKGKSEGLSGLAVRTLQEIGFSDVRRLEAVDGHGPPAGHRIGGTPMRRMPSW